MACIDWLIVGKSFGNCNCDYGWGAIAFTLKDSYGQFNRLHHHGGGVIR